MYCIRCFFVLICEKIKKPERKVEKVTVGLPKIEDLNSREIIEWVKQRKHMLNLSNAKLAELSGVPIGTIDRLLAGKYTEFRYSTIQPILVVLLGHGEATPVPDENDEEQGQYYYDTIEGYKIILDNKNQEINQMKVMLERFQEEIRFLKAESESHRNAAASYQDQIKWLQNIIDSRGLLK